MQCHQILPKKFFGKIVISVWQGLKFGLISYSTCLAKSNGKKSNSNFIYLSHSVYQPVRYKSDKQYRKHFTIGLFLKHRFATYWSISEDQLSIWEPCLWWAVDDLQRVLIIFCLVFRIGLGDAVNIDNLLAAVVNAQLGLALGTVAETLNWPEKN